MGTPVVLMASTISSGVAPGSAERSTATAPATPGEAMEVPLLAWKLSPGTAETMPTPPESTSRKSALLEKYATVSMTSTAPTLTVLDKHAGVARASV